ncbi:MAG TPA: PKD domain-containing protein [Candidatus Hydrogenedentes bacterium]|nr:PKD domain-containing protein [Candidatus Hydrogenedentota bacterium]
MKSTDYAKTRRRKEKTRIATAGARGVFAVLCLMSLGAMGANVNGTGASLNLLSAEYWAADEQVNGAGASLLQGGTSGTGGAFQGGLGATLILDPLSALPGSMATVADFSAAPVSGRAPLEVYFTDLSSGGLYEITAWLWDFGDGETSTERNPVHVYETVGVYTVTLTIITEAGTVSRPKADFITVLETLPVVGAGLLAALAGALTTASLAVLRRRSRG